MLNSSEEGIESDTADAIEMNQGEAEDRPRMEDSSAIILLELFFVSMCMFTLPIGAYYGTLSFCKSYLEEVDWSRDILLSVFTSTVTVWLIISLYAYRAYRDNRNEEQSSEGPVRNKSD